MNCTRHLEFQEQFMNLLKDEYFMNCETNLHSTLMMQYVQYSTVGLF